MSENSSKMGATNNHLNSSIDKSKAPKILLGLLPIVWILLSSILSLAWYIIDYQVEELVAQRTSEYAHSIVKIAADSSAEALLSDDKLQLELLTQNIAKDRYIRKATIYSSDGIIVTQYPEGDVSTEVSAAAQSQSETTEEIANREDSTIVKTEVGSSNDDSDNQQLVYDYLAAKKNIPFIEKIAYKGVTAGWFKLEIDGYQLESDFRENFSRIRMRIFALVGFLIVAISYVLIRYKRQVDSLVNTIHLLLKRKFAGTDDEVARDQKDWLRQVNSLTDASFSKPIRLREQRQQVRWKGEESIESLPLIWLSVDLPKNDHEPLSKQVVKIEKYLKETTNTYFTSFQGEIFSGGIVPFFDVIDSESKTINYSELVAFIFLIKTLLHSLDSDITLRAIIFCSHANKLFSDDPFQNKIILPQRKKQQINRLSHLIAESDICCLLPDSSLISEFAEIKTLVQNEKNINHAWILKEPSHEILNHVARVAKTIAESDRRSG